MARVSISQRLTASQPVLLDGPTGTELARRGVSTESELWSSAALLSDPEIVEEIHRDYVAAGAELITANTFRTQPWSVGKSGRPDDARRLTHVAVNLARSAAGTSAWVAGSMAPLEDCYRPERTPPPSILEREHRAMAELLAAAGVDVILAETQPTVRESVAAVRAAGGVSVPVMVSWVCGRDGRLLSGEMLGNAVSAVLEYGPLAVLVNCLPADTAISAVRELRSAAGSVPVGVYANVGWAEPDRRWVQGDAVDPATYAVHAGDWLEEGVRLIGGCCGTTLEHIRRLRRLIDSGGRPDSESRPNGLRIGADATGRD